MRWQTKALIQRLVAFLPQDLAERIYYRIQRSAGAYRSIEPWEHLSAARDLAEVAVRHGVSVNGAAVLEVGTGPRLLVPIALWLLGARHITTVDVHQYLKGELVFKDLEQIARSTDRVRTALSFPGGTVQDDRLQFLCRWGGKLDRLLSDLSIEYRAPADAGALQDPPLTYDIHVSRSVLEHVPRRDLARILLEAKRVLRRSGVLVHLVDFSDHFAHVDPTISSINFLRFSDGQWQRLAGNQFAYHNRLRADDFESLFRENGLAVAESRLIVDEKALSEFERGFPIHAQFQSRDRSRLACREGLFVLHPSKKLS